MAKKKVISEMKIISDTYPEVSFTVMPLTNRMQTHISGVNIYRDGDGKNAIDFGGLGYDTIGFSLVAMDGLDDFELEFKKRKVGSKRTEQRVTDECMDELPPELYSEILKAINSGANISKEEKENLDFMSPSSQATTSSPAKSAMETTEDVSLKPEAAKGCSAETKSLTE